VIDQAELDRMVVIGLRNQEIIELIRRHCAHAAIEKPVFGGRGLLEAQTGLPLDMRTVRCRYAAHHAGAGMQLEGIALAFWRNNCRGCAHRKIVDIPNLTTYGEKVLADEARAAERAVRERERRERDRDDRRANRARCVAGEPEATRRLIELLDGIDSEHPDERQQLLVEEVRMAPERCTAEAGKVLLKTATLVDSDPLLEALDHLARQGRLPPEPLLAVALAQLRRRPSRTAAEIVVRLRNGLGPGDLTGTYRSLVTLAGRSSEPFERASPYVVGIELAAENDLPALLDEVVDGLRDADNPPRRGHWGYASAELATLRPEVATTLAEPLVAALALPEGMSPYAGSPAYGIGAGLQAVFEADPAAVGAVFETLARTLGSEERKALFHTYDAVFRERLRGAAVPPTVARVAVDSIFARLAGDWGEELADEAVEVIDFISRYHPDLLADRVDTLFGTLIATAGDRDGPAGAVATPEAALLAASRGMSRRIRISKLRDAVGRLAGLRPDETLAGAEAILDATGLGNDEETEELRWQVVRLLGDLGRVPRLAARVLPRLTTLVLADDVVARARAIEALGAIAQVPHVRLPDDVLELVPTWLSDPYRGPHQAAVHALRDGLPVIDHVLNPTILALIRLASAYASDDTRLLGDILERVWSLSRRLEPDIAAGLERWCLEAARHLSGYDLERFVDWRAARADPRNADLIADRILQALRDRERVANPNRRDDELLRRLRDLPAAVLAARAAAIREASSALLPWGVVPALRYVEILQRAGAWQPASQLAEELLSTLPDTIEERGVRARVAAVAAGARLEAAVAVGDHETAVEALADWDAALATRDEVERQRKDPWDLV
jgi:hypothetical protein